MPPPPPFPHFHRPSLMPYCLPVSPFGFSFLEEGIKSPSFSLSRMREGEGEIEREVVREREILILYILPCSVVLLHDRFCWYDYCCY